MYFLETTVTGLNIITAEELVAKDACGMFDVHVPRERL